MDQAWAQVSVPGPNAALPGLPALAGADFPTMKIAKAYHIGTLDPGAKGSDSYEGSGVSVSLDPFRWGKIARIGISPLWQCTKATASFLDNKALTPEHRQAMAAWAALNGLVRFEESAPYGYTETPDLLSRMHLRRGGPTYVQGLVAIAFAEDVLDLDGVWWRGRFSQMDGPKGVIVPCRISTWSWAQRG